MASNFKYVPLPGDWTTSLVRNRCDQGPAHRRFGSFTVTLVFVCLHLVGNVTVAPYGTFSTVALLLITDFKGTAKQRVVAYTSATFVGAALVSLASIASMWVWVAVTCSLVVAMVIQTVTILGGAFSQARFAMLLAWVLAVPTVSHPGAWSDRALGWIVGGVVALIAALVPWPTTVAGLRAQIARRADYLAGLLNGADPASDVVEEPDGAEQVRCRPYGATARDHQLRRAASQSTGRELFLSLPCPTCSATGRCMQSTFALSQ